MRRGFDTKVVAVLSVAQAAFGVLRAMGWFQIGSDLLGRGIVLLPVIGMVAFARGALVAAIAALYVLFAFGLWTGRAWARGGGACRGGAVAATIAALYVLFAFGLWTGRAWARGVGWPAAVLNLLLAASVLIQGELIVRLLLSMLVPLIVIWYLLTSGGEPSRTGSAMQTRPAG